MIKPIDRQHVGKNNNIIEINGKKYDAKTGELLSVSKSHTKTHTVKPKTSISKPVTHIKSTSMKDVVRKPGKQINHHPHKASKTLMRNSVKKPSTPLKRHVKAQGPSEVPATIFKKASSSQKKAVNNIAVRHKNPLIQHFAPIEPTSIQPVALKPIVENSKITSPAPSRNNKSKSKTTSELLENAIKNATSHEQKPHKIKKSRKKQVSALMAVISVMLIGFVGYQEMPNIKLELASAKAGFSASLPGYKPAGYSVGDINYSSGVVATTFNSNSDQRAYTLTQKTSNWDSRALLDNFVKPNSDKYETIYSSGNTIYIYGDSNATWINGGVWYIVQSNGSLTNAQLAEIAKTL